MKILFNGLLYSKQGAGISSYAKNLMLQYNNLKKTEIDLILNDSFKNEFNNLKKVIVKDCKSSASRILTEQVKLANKYNKYDIIHFPDYASPIVSKSKRIATIHDLAFITVKEHYTSNQIVTKKFLFNQTIKNADMLICISRFTYKELKKYYPNISDDRIRIVNNGFNKPIVSNINSNTDITKFGIYGEFILFVGTIAPSKNLIRFLDAFKNSLTINPKLKFVIVGKKGWGFNQLEHKINELQIKSSVIITGYVTYDELEKLYNRCLFVAYPSIYEGFGLPALEALSRKKAVLLSNIDVFKETIGSENALFCNPYSVEDISKKLIDLIQYKNLRDRIIEKGYEKSKEFSWDKCAKETWMVYEELLRRDK
ncbi:glycosyltransferase family 1 protein [Clostridium sartagoforme]|uniref:glycosyltransferase family 4 protein n=1 Tax=Clostridium sartagoforme TaxID=84031 RepID=UPI0031DC7CBD